jgi:SAM-dependent methyltransferase
MDKLLVMDNGWRESASAWIADQGDGGDFGRSHVLDPVMLSRALRQQPRHALDVGCGEGRFCRMLKAAGVLATGIEPTPALLAAARERDPAGLYLEGTAEQLPFADEAFELVVSYLTLVDISDYRTAIREMARVLKPGGSLLIANLNSFNTACGDTGWMKDSCGKKLHYPLDNYLDERAMWVEYRGIRIVNHHRPLSAYLSTLLEAGLRLVYFDEPAPTPDTSPARTKTYRRAPWFLVMEWVKPE